MLSSKHCSSEVARPQTSAHRLIEAVKLRLPDACAPTSQFLSILACGAVLSVSSPALALVAPQVGNCVECVGEVDGALNICTLPSVSCISVQNNDQEHFVAPWQYDGKREDAINYLVYVATGGSYDPGVMSDPYVSLGVSRIDAFAYSAKQLWSVTTGSTAPSRPGLKKNKQFIAFDGKVVDQHSTADGSIYIRMVFGLPEDQQEAGEPGLSTPAMSDLDLTSVVDAEFIFPKDDNIVNIRASSRGEPLGGQGRLSLSFQYGLEYDQNYARQLVEQLRKAVHWEIMPVISDFDPKFNNDKQLWFERFFDPYQQLVRNNEEPLDFQ